MPVVTVEQANTYFATRLGASRYWTADTEKAAALATAENQLATLYALADTEACRNAVCEQALFLLRDPDGVEARAALQAQGVTEAGIVGEKYAGAAGIAVCPFAAQALADLALGTAGSGTFDWER
jgi:hypothetical protein